MKIDEENLRFSDFHENEKLIKVAFLKMEIQMQSRTILARYEKCRKFEIKTLHNTIAESSNRFQISLKVAQERVSRSENDFCRLPRAKVVRSGKTCKRELKV